ncbi:DUF3037 domain-containing protein [Auritidibacter ignavus]|uniref:DUF3037 domain-containing protein n=1 Tax=Auritidibacter ignavus TaxID=678932 RepID=UPI003A5CD863
MGDYTAWVLRYVPNSIRGEFINIGILVGSYSADWAIRRVSNFKYANRLGGQAEALAPLLEEIEALIPTKRTELAQSAQHSTPMTRPLPLSDPSRLELSVPAVEEMRAHYQNILQLSDPLASYGNSASELATLLFKTLVANGPEPACR